MGLSVSHSGPVGAELFEQWRDLELRVGLHPGIFEGRKTMRKTLLTLIGAGVLAMALAGTASAQTYPNVSNLKAFSAEANFMSLPGYLRYVYQQQTGQWLTYAEAQRVVQQQT